MTDQEGLFSSSGSRASEPRNEHQRVQSDLPNNTSKVCRSTWSKDGDIVEGQSLRLSESSNGHRSTPKTTPAARHDVPSLLQHTSASSHSTLNESTPEQTASQDVIEASSITAYPITRNKSNHVEHWRGNEETPSAACTRTPAASSSNPDISEESTNVGMRFDELVDRLLSPASSKREVKFLAIFLCIYRQFAAPSFLLAAIVSRFHGMRSSGSAPAQRTTAQLRFLSVLERWISEYPGDFAPATTRSKMTSFLSDIAGHRPFAMALEEINLHLDNVFENDDTAWAYSDVTRSHEAVETRSSGSISAKSVSSTVLASPPREETSNDMNAGEKASSMIKRISTTPSTASSVGKSSSYSLGSSQTTTSLAESAPRQAHSLTPYPQTSLCKVHWHLFMRLSDDEIAQELTRIDWIMFSSITPRDLVRHISLSDGEKEKCRNLEHVSRMISHFNHVAFWIANVILLRDKPKHRAKSLEKCMAIAWVCDRNWLPIMLLLMI